MKKLFLTIFMIAVLTVVYSQNTYYRDADPTVPYEQSVALHKKFEQARVKTKFMTVAGGGHGKFSKEQNSEVSKAIIDFLKEINLIQ